MKKKILFITLTAAVSFSACTNMSQKNKEDQQTNAIEHKGHDHNNNIKKTDSLGMKMGGNELDSKKK